MSSAEPTYVGRFAPTPSGPLHLGSLYTAVASYLDARAHGGKWLLRIDDLDGPRIVTGSEESIIETLKHHGLFWDDEIIHQQDHNPLYASALEELIDLDRIFFCTCSRRMLVAGEPYPGTCGQRRSPPSADHSIRVLAGDAEISFRDCLQGELSKKFAQAEGDFIIVRRDGIVSYPLAAAVSDSMNDISVVVRGADLLSNTHNQLLLQDWLGLTRPQYLHLPVLCERDQIKLSKRDLSVAVDNSFAAQNLVTSMQLLEMAPPSNMNVNQLLQWGVEHWQRSALPKGTEITKFVSI